MQIKDYLYGKKLYLSLLNQKSESMSEVNWNLLDKQVLRVIKLILSKNVAKEKTTKG